MDTRPYPGNSVIQFLATFKSWEEGWGLGGGLGVGRLWLSVAYMSLLYDWTA